VCAKRSVLKPLAACLSRPQSDGLGASEPSGATRSGITAKTVELEGVRSLPSVAVTRLVRDKELSDLLADAVRQGWRIERERKHVKCLAPDGHTMVVVGYSAHGNRALENARAELRRAGLRV
jgi:hypothetical protein